VGEQLKFHGEQFGDRHSSFVQPFEQNLPPADHYNIKFIDKSEVRNYYYFNIRGSGNQKSIYLDFIFLD